MAWTCGSVGVELDGLASGVEEEEDAGIEEGDLE
jgi:hypothetical protein